MRFNDKFEEEEPKLVLGEQDAIPQLPKEVSEHVMNATHDLTIFLGQRTKFFKEKCKGLESDTDFSTCALIERLAFYETMINSLIGVTKKLEERLGGQEGGEGN
jgi:hypothetical protein